MFGLPVTGVIIICSKCPTTLGLSRIKRLDWLFYKSKMTLVWLSGSMVACNDVVAIVGSCHWYCYLLKRKQVVIQLLYTVLWFFIMGNIDVELICFIWGIALKKKLQESFWYGYYLCVENVYLYFRWVLMNACIIKPCVYMHVSFSENRHCNELLALTVVAIKMDYSLCTR